MTGTTSSILGNRVLYCHLPTPGNSILALPLNQHNRYMKLLLTDNLRLCHCVLVVSIPVHSTSCQTRRCTPFHNSLKTAKGNFSPSLHTNSIQHRHSYCVQTCIYMTGHMTNVDWIRKTCMTCHIPLCVYIPQYLHVELDMYIM